MPHSTHVLALAAWLALCLALCQAGEESGRAVSRRHLAGTTVTITYSSTPTYGSTGSSTPASVWYSTSCPTSVSYAVGSGACRAASGSDLVDFCGYPNNLPTPPSYLGYSGVYYSDVSDCSNNDFAAMAGLRGFVSSESLCLCHCVLDLACNAYIYEPNYTYDTSDDSANCYLLYGKLSGYTKCASSKGDLSGESLT